MIRSGRQVATTVLATLLTVPFVSAQDSTGTPWTIEKLMARMAEVESARARFTETREAALFNTPLVLTGTLVYERPSKIERTVLTPYVERFAADGNTLVIENGRPAGARVSTLSSQPLVHAFVASIRATLAGDEATLAQFYHLNLDGNRTKWTLRLEPVDTEVADYVTLIKISGADNHIDTIEVNETGGDRSIMKVTGEEGTTQ